MKFAESIHQRALKPRFVLLEEEFPHDKEHISLELDLLESKLDIFFSLEQRDELYFQFLCFKTQLKGPYLAVLDAYFEILMHRSFESINRVSLKELDYFFREDHSQPSFSVYTPELFEIIGIGEKLLASQIKITKEEKIFEKSSCGEFSELSLSEQIEFFEEFCSHYIYSSKSFKDVYLTVEDYTEDGLVLSSKNKITFEKLLEVERLFQSVFECQIKLILVN
ncbi:MAG: hypothetical protein QF441_05625 [Bacteriovoracaceae bacterium]|jgi:hypothetical protein|nr:hypothetical protein [Bacteriovoracaceae bacterium]